MRLALTDLFRAKWSAAIHEEWDDGKDSCGILTQAPLCGS